MTLLDLLPKINASLNATAGCLVLCGLRAIRRRDKVRHWKCMVGAMSASTLFLVGYLTRIALQGTHRIASDGTVRTIYLFILISHMTLAATVVPLIIRTVYLSIKGRFDAHRRIARITYPVWLYVSATGVIVYVMLYHFPGHQ